MEALLWIAISMAGIQFLAGIGCLISSSTDFKAHAADKAESERRNSKGSYTNLREPEYYADEMEVAAMWSRRFGLIAATSPFSIIVVPLAALVAAVWGIKQAVGTTVPALTYKGE